MFIADLGGYPYADPGIKVLCVSKHLAKMAVVGLIELIFYHDLVVGADDLGNDVCCKRPDRSLCLYHFQTGGKTKRVGQKLKIIWLRQPRIERMWLRSPYRLYINALQATQRWYDVINHSGGTPSVSP